ncbi:MAG: hypothetical protein JRN20_13215 [Nitrososphaerota archaeon]|nr:hypothetical protein [Nitrososphaerota archaeon]
MKVGQAGWARDTVVLKSLSKDLTVKDSALAWLEPDTGKVDCTNQVLLRKWQEEGIFGRQISGRLYPKDGQKFLDELPFVYNGSYFWAEPINKNDIENVMLDKKK